ncbi:sulfotransferase family 2 domain-containing protein [Mycolicibacterium sp. S3B2]|uniref:sulfotransferase family 2 domain-containing protein n=1 Tax=Mycolicibacterium sp. S3B2 TaxID=3415120 RepID=UPI003C7B4C0A
MPVLTVGGKNILYIHVPKTGGTSVEKLMRSYGGVLWSYSPRRKGLPCTPQHFHSELLATAFGATADESGREHPFDFVFMTVRHPVKRLLSEYRYQRTLGEESDIPLLLKDRFASARFSGPARMLSFDLWCRYAVARFGRNSYFADNHLRPQSDFDIWDASVFRLEDGLDAIRNRLDKVIGTPGCLPSEPSRKARHSAGDTNRLSSTTRKLIAKHFDNDFSRFQYRFDTP